MKSIKETSDDINQLEMIDENGSNFGNLGVLNQELAQKGTLEKELKYQK